MAAPFGFSVGNLIAGCQLLYTTFQAVTNVPKASAEYKSTIADLEFFQNVLRGFSTLQKNQDDNASAKRFAQHCCVPIAAFLEKIHKYETALVPEEGAKRSVKSFLRKVPNQLKWALYVHKEATKVRREVEARFGAITAHLVMANRKDFAHTRRQLDDISSVVKDIHDQKAVVVITPPPSAPEMQSYISVPPQRTAELQNQVESVNRVHVTIGTLTLSFERDSRGSQDTLEGLFTLAMYIWQALIVIASILPKSPTTLLESNIHLTDALGRPLSLSFDGFRYWTTLKARLDIAFDDCPGRMNVRSRNFGFLLLEKGQRRVLDFTTWTKEIYPGAKVAMVMLVLGMGREIGECPRCGATSHKTDRFGWSTCRDCALIHRLDNREFMTAEEQSALTDELDHGDDGYLDDIEWNVDGNADHREGDRDIGAFEMVQWFTEPCDRCEAVFISIPKLIQHLHHVHGDQRYQL